MSLGTHWRNLLAPTVCALALAVGCGSSADISGNEVASTDVATTATTPAATPTPTTAVPEEAAVADSPADAEADAAEPDAAEPQPGGVEREEAVDPEVTDSGQGPDNEQGPDSEQAVVTEFEGGRPAAPNGQTAPDVGTTPEALAIQLAAAEVGLQDAESTAEERADWGHLHQVVIRKMGYEPDWDIRFFEALPPEFHARTLLHVGARRALIDLHSGFDAADFIPAWQIVEPEPATSLLSYYREAEVATGIEWEFLAAINLIETGMGRIRGLSSAGAQGPMQFLPTTWAEAGIGEGDIEDPRDAINGAGRYLVRRGGPGDMQNALWGYNNSDNYVTAVQAYAELLRQDPTAYEAIYNWEIYFFTETGDIWLPAGFRTDETMDLYDYLAANPWSAPDPGIR